MLQPPAGYDKKEFDNPEPQKVHLRDNEKQEEALNTSPEFSYILTDQLLNQRRPQATRNPQTG